MTKTIEQLAQEAGVSIGSHDGSPYPTITELERFAAIVREQHTAELLVMGPVDVEALYETIIRWDEGGGKRSRRELARHIHNQLAAAVLCERGQQETKMADILGECLGILKSFDYENDEDSQSYAFFKAHLNVDWFFHVENKVERQLAAIRKGDDK